MLETTLMTHDILIKVFLGVLVAGLAIPLMSAKKPQQFGRWSFLYTLVFQALATMIAFSGAIALFYGQTEWNTSVILMIVIWAALMFIEIKKYKLIKVANLQKESTLRLLRGAFVKIGLLQIALVALLVVLKILEAKGIISL